LLNHLVFGSLTIQVLRTIPSSPKQLNYIEIGSVGGPTVQLPGALLRSRNIILSGSGLGSWSIADLRRQLPSLFIAVGEAKFHDDFLKEARVEIVDFKDIAHAWQLRIVMKP
jgi:hypothetical protein